MTETPRISVVLAVYNGELYLAETLESILAQDGADFEVIAIDDASTDATPAVLATFADKDARLRVHRNEQNQGLTRSLIVGCALARGRYIARHDAGDLSVPTRLARQAALLDADERVALVSCWTELTGPELEHLSVTRGTTGATDPIAIIDLSTRSGVKDGPTHHGAVMFRAETYRAVGGYRPEFRYGQDWDLWFRLAERGLYQVVPEVLYRARILPGSVSSVARPEQQRLAALAREALVERKAGRSEAEVLARAALVESPSGARSRPDEFFYFIGEALRRNGNPAARRFLADAVRRKPWSVKAWIRWAQSLALGRGESRP